MSPPEPRRALLRDYTASELRTLVQRAVAVGLDFTSGRARDHRVLRYAPEQQLLAHFASPLPEHGADDADLIDALADVARWSISQADPCYLAFPDTGDSVAGVLADIVGAFLNQNLIAFDRSAPAASVIEAQVIAWLRELVGYTVAPLDGQHGLDQLGGMWTSGGNMSNHVAMAAAVAHAFPEVRRVGLRGISEQPAIVLASGVEHFSYLGAAQVLGLGSDSLVWTAPNSDFTTDVAGVERQLQEPPANTRIAMVVGVAGNCRTTGLDDLHALADVCQRHGVWFHVDACHGGSLLFSDRLRNLVAGIERADSVSLDPHKGLFVTYPSSYVLFRDPAILARFSRYPDRTADPTCLDLGLVTPFYGSRGFQSLKLWALLRHQGRRGVAALVEARHATFQRLKALLDRTGYLQTLGTSAFYRCAFVFLPDALRSRMRELATEPLHRPALRELISTYTSRVCDQLYRSGTVTFDLFALADLADHLGLGTDHKYKVMGMCVGHPYIDAGVEQRIEKAIHEVAVELTEHMRADLDDLQVSASAVTASRTTGPAGW